MPGHTLVVVSPIELFSLPLANSNTLINLLEAPQIANSFFKATTHLNPHHFDTQPILRTPISKNKNVSSWWWC